MSILRFLQIGFLSTSPPIQEESFVSEYKMRAGILLVVVSFMATAMSGCGEIKLPDTSRYIGVAEKVDIIPTNDLDSSGRKINYYDVWINESVVRIRTGCFAGQNVYRGEFRVKGLGRGAVAPIIFCHGKARKYEPND